MVAAARRSWSRSARSRLLRRCRGPGTPGSGTRRCAAPRVRWSASVSIRVSALASRSSPRSVGSASSASVMTRAWARFTAAARPARRGLGPPLVQRRCEAASARTRPWASRVAVADQDAVVRSPVSTSRCRRRWPAAVAVRPGRGDHPRQPDQQVLLLGDGAELRGDRGDLVQPTLDPGQGLGVGGGHGTSQPSTTDTRARSEPVIHKGFRASRPPVAGCVSRLVAGAPRTSTTDGVAGSRDGPDGPPQPADTRARRVLKAATAPGVR